MSGPAVLAPQARSDLRKAVRRIGADNLEAARSLRQAIEAALRRLGENPMLGRRRPTLLPEPYRFWSLNRFRMLLIYDPTADPVRVLRVLHTARELRSALDEHDL